MTAHASPRTEYRYSCDAPAQLCTIRGMTNTATAPTPGTTPAFFLQAAASFGVSVVAIGIGIAYLPVDAWVRAFLAIGVLYAVTSTFTLAKCVRDRIEQGAVVNRLDKARVDKLLA